MFISGGCFAIALILAISGLGIDILATQEGTGSESVGRASASIDANIEYAAHQFRIDVKYTVTSSSSSSTKSYHSSVTYANASNTACNLDDEDECDDLKDLRDAGNEYIKYNVAGITFTCAGMILAFFIVAMRCICSCNPHCRWRVPFRFVIAFLAALSCGMYVAAYVVFYKKIVKGLDDTMDYVLCLYYPDVCYLVDEWDSGQAGASLVCLITAAIICFLTIWIAIFVEKKRDHCGMHADCHEDHLLVDDHDDDGPGEHVHHHHHHHHHLRGNGAQYDEGDDFQGTGHAVQTSNEHYHL